MLVEDVVFPYQLFLKPSTQVYEAYDTSIAMEKNFEQIEIGTVLYKVSALVSPPEEGTLEEDWDVIPVGVFKTTSTFETTEFAQKIYFKHQDMREDLKLKPEWSNAVGVQDAKCPFQGILY